MKFNINDDVQIKLTKEGFQCYLDNFWNKYNCFKKTMPYAKKWLNKYHKGSKKGWYKFQLWEVMSIFGSKIYMGGLNLFDTEIIIEKEN